MELLLDALGKKDGYEGYANLRIDVLYDKGKMAGGCVYEYYPRSGCGIISYFCMGPAFRGKGYGTLLVRAAEREIHSIALRLGRPYANAVFMETNKPGGPEHGDDFSVEERFRTFDQLGYRCIEYAYAQPPLEDHKKPSDTLYLTVCTMPPHRLHPSPQDKVPWRMPMPLLREWMLEYWDSSQADVTQFAEYHAMIKWFEDNSESTPFVRLRSLLDTDGAKL